MKINKDNPIKSDAYPKSDWEREIIEKLALAAVTEQTRGETLECFLQVITICLLIAILG